MTRNDSLFICGAVLGLLVGAWLGFWGGTHDACASVKAEWRDSKCVRVIVEDVK